MLKFLYCCNPSPKSRQYYFVFKFVKKLIILDRQPCSSLEWCSSLEPRSSSLEPTGTMTRPQPDSLAQLVSLPHAPYTFLLSQSLLLFQRLTSTRPWRRRPWWRPKEWRSRPSLGTLHLCWLFCKHLNTDRRSRSREWWPLCPLAYCSISLGTLWPENTNWRGGITVQLTSCLFCLDSAFCRNNKNVQIVHQLINSKMYGYSLLLSQVICNNKRIGL